MNDISYSFNYGNQSASSSQQGPLLSHFGIKAAAGPSGTILLMNSRTHQKVMVRPEVASALLQCKPFRSMAAHIKHICETVAALKGNPEAVRQTLEMMLEAGMFETAESVWQSLSTEQISSQSAPVRVFILTCDRPPAGDAVTKLALSAAPRLLRQTRLPRVYVLAMS